MYLHRDSNLGWHGLLFVIPGIHLFGLDLLVLSHAGILAVAVLRDRSRFTPGLRTMMDLVR